MPRRPSSTQQVLAHVGANLRRARRARGLTQEKAAELAGIETRTVRNIESAKVAAQLDTLIDLAAVLEVSPGDLFEEVEIEPPRPGRPRGSNG